MVLKQEIQMKRESFISHSGAFGSIDVVFDTLELK